MKTGFFFSVVSAFLIPLSALAADFGDMKSSTLTTKAWACLQTKDWDSLKAYTEKCAELYTKHAVNQQSELTSFPPAQTANSYWALNDVATCRYLQARALKEQGNNDEAKKIAESVSKEFSFAQAYDPQGWYWSVANACKDLIQEIQLPVDFEDYTSETLTRKAWESLNGGQPELSLVYVAKCFTLYEAEADKQQKSLQQYAPKEQAFDYWALNDVGTCYFIKGEAHSQKKQWKEAVEAYQKVMDSFSFAQCWNPSGAGFFWKVAVSARGKLNKIKAEQSSFQGH